MNRFSFLFFLVSGILCFRSPATAQQQDLRFERITTADGLSNMSVNALVQDHEGFMWIGTQEGLNKYDGYAFTVFRHDPLDSTSLTDSRIESLLVDHAGTLWVGTNEGLNRYDRNHNRFIRYQHNPDDPHGLTPVLLEDHAHRLWIGTQNGGLFRYEPDRNGFTRFLDDPDEPNNLLDDQVRAMIEDRQGYLWIGTGEPFDPEVTGGGLLRFDPETGTAKRFLHDPNDPYSLLDNRVSALFEDRQGVLWVGTCGSGLHQYDPEREAFIRMEPDHEDPNHLYAPQAETAPYSGCPHVKIIHEDMTGAFWVGTLGAGFHRYDSTTKTQTLYAYDPSNPASLNNNLMWSFYEDRHGTLWIGNLNGGLNKLDPYTSKFSTYKNDPNAPGSLSHDDVRAIYEAPSEPEVFWIGTRGGGLNRLDRQARLITPYRNSPNDAHSLGDNTVNAFYEDHEGVFWVGTGDGLDRMDRRTGRFEHYRYDPGDPNSLSAGSVESIYEDQSSVLWIGIFSGGLNRFDRARATFTQYEFPAVTGVGTYDQSVYAIYEDTAGTLWVATWLGGLYRFDREADTFIVVLEGTGANWLHEDASGRFWLGTQSDGLLLFDRTSGDMRSYTTREGLPGNTVYGILEDEDGHLWISTENGLSKFNPQTETFTTYDVSDGLPSNTFDPASAYRGADGALFFGGQGGLTVFYPDQIKENPHPPEVVLTGLKIFNETVEPGADAPLSQAIARVEELTLTHAQNDLTFEYVGLHYSNPEQNQYQYRLDEYDPGWIEVSTQQSARYTNLEHGDYVFRVKASNSDGLWNEEGASIRVVIKPPWWRTWWAYLSYGLLFVTSIFALDRLQRRRLLRKEREQSFLREKELRADAAEAMANYLQSENLRQTQELDAARDLQLSMLPETMPEHPTVELAAFMETATEVGGDYYDFDLAADGTLTLAIGDATGHGLKAGTMVTAAKSLFANMAEEEDLVHVLEKSARALKRMGLPKLYMALALARLRDHTLELAGAGMPPALVYRAATQQVETVALKGMPLGGPGAVPYSKTSVPLSPGDTVVLMSDGFPELFNEADEMLGYEQAVTVFEEVAHKSPEEIIDHFKASASTWMNGRAQDDDVTFLVMRVKEG